MYSVNPNFHTNVCLAAIGKIVIKMYFTLCDHIRDGNEDGRASLTYYVSEVTVNLYCETCDPYIFTEPGSAIVIPLNSELLGRFQEG